VLDDIALDDGFIRVRAQLSRQRERVESKTVGSRREVVLVPQLARILGEHRMASRYKAMSDYDFPAPDGRGLMHDVAARGVVRAVTNAGRKDVTPAHVPARLRLDADLRPHTRPRRRRPPAPGTPTRRITLSTYAHPFERARAADEMRQKLGDGFGDLVAARPS
jgi:hypothetical protein